jgi:small subunit ribosomal protein S16
VSVKIRLKKIGRKKQPSFRIVVTESRNPPRGKIIENIGHYCPYLKNKPLELDLERLYACHSKGAIITDAVKRLVRRKRRGDEPVIKEKNIKASEEDKQPEAEPDTGTQEETGNAEPESSEV